MSEYVENLVDWDFGMEFEKLAGDDDSVMYIAGGASNPYKDEDGENMDMESLKGVFETYMKNPIIRFMHDKAPQWRGAIGTVVEKYVDSEGVEHRTSFDGTPYLVAKIEKSHVPAWMWDSIKKGVYKGFSIGGKALKKINGTIFVKSWLETSIVDVPAAKGSFFTVLKAACTTGNCPFEKGGLGSGRKGHTTSKAEDAAHTAIDKIKKMSHEELIKAIEKDTGSKLPESSRKFYDKHPEKARAAVMASAKVALIKAEKNLPYTERMHRMLTSKSALSTPILDKFIRDNGETHMKIDKFVKAADEFLS